MNNVRKMIKPFVYKFESGSFISFTLVTDITLKFRPALLGRFSQEKTGNHVIARCQMIK